MAMSVHSLEHASLRVGVGRLFCFSVAAMAIIHFHDGVIPAQAGIQLSIKLRWAFQSGAFHRVFHTHAFGKQSGIPPAPG